MGVGRYARLMASQSTKPAKLAPGTVPAIVAMGLAVFVIANDVTAMSVALPAMESDFDTTVSTVQWVVNAYALVFGVLIVSGGRLADMFGRRRVLFIGAAIFAFFSLLGGLAPNVGLLILCRALMGIGGALMWPAILGLIYEILPDDRAGLAGGLVIGTAGLGNAAGPLLGGFLTQEFSWRWILFLNVPIAAVACLVTWRTVPADHPTDRQRIDYAGIATLSVGLVALLVGLGQAPIVGWGNPAVLASFAVCVVLLVLFVIRERRAGPAALIPRSVMGNRDFTMACVATLLMSSTFFASLLYLPQFLQKILDANALVSGLALLPLMGTFALTSFSEGMILRRIGMKAVVTIGAACMAVGPVLIAVMIRPDSGYITLLPGMIVLGVGVGLFYSSVTTAGVTALDPSQSSLAGGILYMFQIAGGAVGLGITTTIFLLGSSHGLTTGTEALGVQLTASEQNVVQGVLVGTDSSSAIVARYAGQVAQQLTDLVEDAFSTGLRWAFAFDAVLALAGLVCAALFVAGPLKNFGRDVESADAAGSPADTP